MKKKGGFTKGFKMFLVALVVGIVAIVAVQFKLIPTSGSSGSSASSGGFLGIGGGSNSDGIVVSVVTWGGYAGGEYFNGGFESSDQSRYVTELNTKVSFKLDDQVATGRQSFLNGNRNVLWATVDALPTEINHLKVNGKYPKVFFQSDWSRGGDAIVAKTSIHSVKDLKGKKVSCAFNTPSHSMLLKMLDANDMTVQDLNIIKVDDATASAQAYQSGNVDAAVVWSPDDETCVKKVPDTHVLISSKEASHIISDVFIASDEYIQSHHKELVALVKGWLKGAAELNSNPEAKQKAAAILSKSFTGISPEDAMGAIQNARLTTFGDNKQFFNQNSSGVHAREIYENMARLYTKSGYLKEDVPDWSQIYDGSILADVDLSTDGPNAPEGTEDFSSRPVIAKVTEEKVFTDKRLTIEFATGSSMLTEDNKQMLRSQFLPIASSFSNMPIQVVGNTDNTGNPATNLALSKSRAQAVADFMRKEGGFDSHRFYVKGAGSSAPISDNTTPDGRARNRRTDLQLIKEAN